ncbi:hypothetical protein L596_018302 [Steinernema carpocapsae]|uniref:Uncharacterized protein n=1 Tax=Steinernema carpocapsae TaxID=34508 RepID=A0A4V6A201_STECR|nr:hypothetical protein L596_018302 [Steinernema carpocapsae]
MTHASQTLPKQNLSQSLLRSPQTPFFADRKSRDRCFRVVFASPRRFLPRAPEPTTLLSFSFIFFVALLRLPNGRRLQPAADRWEQRFTFNSTFYSSPNHNKNCVNEEFSSRVLRAPIDSLLERRRFPRASKKEKSKQVKLQQNAIENTRFLRHLETRQFYEQRLSSPPESTGFEIDRLRRGTAIWEEEGL